MVEKFETGIQEKVAEFYKKAKAEKPDLLKKPLHLTQWQAADWGIEIPAGWSLELSPTGREDKPYDVTYVTPDRWKLTEAGTYISPQGKEFTAEQIEAQQVSEVGWEGIAELFPEREIEELKLYAEEKPEQFLAEITSLGRTEEVEDLLTQIGLAEEDIDLIFLAVEEAGIEYAGQFEDALSRLAEEDRFDSFFKRLYVTYGVGTKVFMSETRHEATTVDQILYGVKFFAEKYPGEFLSAISEMGPDEDTLALVRLMGYSEEDIKNEIFPELGKAERPDKRGFFEKLRDTLWDYTVKPAVGAFHRIDKPLELAVSGVIATIKGDDEYLRLMNRSTDLYGFGAVYDDKLYEAYWEWDGIPSWSKWVIPLSNPVWWTPAGFVASKLAQSTRMVPVLGKMTQHSAKGIMAAERGMSWPIAKPIELAGKGTKALFRRHNVIPLPKIPHYSELIAHIEKNHPGRLGRGTVGRIHGYGDIEAQIKGARLAQVHADEIGGASGDWAVSQLELICNIERQLGIREGYITRGIASVREGVPRIGGKTSYAFGDVFEYYKFYNFSNPAVKRWIAAAHQIIDDVVKVAGEHGVSIEKGWVAELMHYFPRKVVGKIGVSEGKFVRVGAGRLGAKPSFTKERIFDFMQEGMDAGYLYANATESLKAYIHGVYRMVGNQHALEILRPLLKPLAKETEIGAAKIAEAIMARKLASRAANLETVIQRVIRGEKLHGSTLRALRRNFPELAPQIEAALGLPTEAARRSALKGVLTEVRAIKAERQLAAAEARAERASVVQMASHRGFTEGMVDLPALRNRVFMDATVNGKVVTGQAIARKIDKLFKDKANRWLELSSQTSRGLVTLEAAVDTSAPFIQGLYTLGYDTQRFLHGHPSFIWARTAFDHVRVMAHPKVLGGFRAKHAETYMKWRPYGLIMADDLSDFYKGLGFINKTFGKIPIAGWLVKKIYGRAGIGFAAWGEEARILLLESMDKGWLRAGGTRWELVEFVNSMTGVVSTKAIGVGATQRAAEGTFLFAGRYFRSNLIFLNMMRHPNTISGRMAIKTIGGMAAGLTLSYCTLSAILGQEPKLKPWPKKYGGDGAEAFSVRIGEHNVGLPGFVYSFAKMWASLITTAMENPDQLLSFDVETILKNHPEFRWLFYKTSPLVGLTYEMTQGKDIFGNRFEEGFDYLEAFYEKFLTIATQSILVQDPPATPFVFAAEVLGLRTYPQSAWSKFYELTEDIVAGIPASELTDKQLEKRKDGDLGWKDLDRFQQDKILEECPELQKLLDEAQDSSERRATKEWADWGDERERIWAERDVAEANILEQFRDPANDYDIRWLRNQLGEIAGDTHVKWEELEKRFPNIYEELEKSRVEGLEDAPLFDIAYDEWYNWVLYGEGTQDEGGNPIWPVIEARKKEWMEKWGQEYYDMILELRESGYADKDRLLFKVWEDKQRLDEYWQIVDDSGDPDREARLIYRQDSENIENEARLIFLGYVSDIRNPEAEELVQQWCEEYNIAERDIPAFAKLIIPEEAMRRYGITDPDVAREYTRLSAEFGGSSAEARLFRLEHPGFDEWGRDEWGWREIDANADALRISVKWRDLDDQYDALGDRDSAQYIEDDAARQAARDQLLASNPEYADDRRCRDAYNSGFPDALIDTYVDYYKIPRAGYEDDWFLMENDEFYQAALDLLGWEPRDFTKVPTREVAKLYAEYQKLGTGRPRVEFRCGNKALDDWLVKAFGYTKVYGTDRCDFASKPKTKEEKPSWLEEMEEKAGKEF